jgi:prolyl-tRNA synthetase
VRLEIGPRDMEKDSVFAARRDRAPKDKQSVARGQFVAGIGALLQSIQDGVFARAKAFREQHTRRIDSRDEFYEFFKSEREEEGKPVPIHGGFALAHFGGDLDLEHKIREDLSVTVRCIPLEKSEPGTCPFTGKPSPQRVVWAKAY